MTTAETKLKAAREKNLTGANAEMNETKLIKTRTELGLRAKAKTTVVRLSGPDPKTATAVVVLTARDPGNCDVAVSKSVMDKLKINDGTLVTVDCLTRLDWLRRKSHYTRLAPIFSIIAALCTVAAVLTGQASAAGFPPLKVAAAILLCVSGLFAGWVSWRAVGP
jgi:hypothetical protein